MRVVLSQDTASRAFISRAFALLLITVVGMFGCQSPVGGGETPDSSTTSIALHGRVVNFETCSGGNGCRPVEGVQVRLRQLPSYVSEPTDAPGRFLLPVPPTHQDDVLVDPGAFPYAPTLNPWAAPPAISDVYGIELFTLPIGTNADGSASIVTALEQQTPPIRLLDNGATLGEGGYIGQVLRRDEEGQHAVMGASVTVLLEDDWPAGVPEPEVRYISSVPRYEEGDLLFAPDYPATGPFGIFVIPTRQQTAVITVHVETSDTIFTDVIAPIGPGMVTVGIHYP